MDTESTVTDTAKPENILFVIGFTSKRRDARPVLHSWTEATGWVSSKLPLRDTRKQPTARP